jgi:hypothetical protein
VRCRSAGVKACSSFQVSVRRRIRGLLARRVQSYADQRGETTPLALFAVVVIGSPSRYDPLNGPDHHTAARADGCLRVLRLAIMAISGPEGVLANRGSTSRSMTRATSPWLNLWTHGSSAPTSVCHSRSDRILTSICCCEANLQPGREREAAPVRTFGATMKRGHARSINDGR